LVDMIYSCMCDCWFFVHVTASNYLLYTGPVIVLAMLALLYLELEKRFPAK
jgi:hypothetical protein